MIKMGEKMKIERLRLTNKTFKQVPVAAAVDINK